MCPDDSNGIYNVPNGTLVNSGDTVLPSQHNPWANDSATAISNRFSKDGRAPATGNWNLNTFRITNLATPVANGDAATKQYVDGAVPNNVYSLVSSNTTVTASDKGKWYRTVTSGITFTPDSASTLGANNFFRIKNDSSGLVFVDPSGSETINGSATLLIPSGQEVFVISDGINLFATIYSSPQQGPQLQGYISGLTATINAVTPATNIDVAPGAAASSASPYYLMQLLSGLTKNTNLPWVVGTGQGSLDAGTIGDGRYYGFLIQRYDTGVVDVLTSLSSTAPTMPANYDRRSPALFTFTRTAGVNSPVLPLLGSTSVAWEVIQEINTGLVSFIDITNLSVFDKVWIQGTIYSSAAGTPLLNVSTDNGASFINTANYEQQFIIGNATTVGAAKQAAQTAFGINGGSGISTISNRPSVMDLTVFNMNKTSYCQFKSEVSDMSASYVKITNGDFNGSTARNALRLTMSTGTIAGKFTVMGRRG